MIRRAVFAFALSASILGAQSDPLADMNATFRSWYKAEKARRLEHPGPVILVEGDKAVLLREGKREEAGFLTPAFHRLKAMAHIPLAIFVKLSPTVDQPLTAADLADLKAFETQVRTAFTEIWEEHHMGPSERRQVDLGSASAAFLEKAAKDGVVTAKALQDYIRKASPMAMANANQAVALELAGLDKQVRAWRAGLSKDEWRDLHVVVMGSHMAREQEASMQYFERLLRQKGEGDRVIFAEGLWEEPKALDLLATHLTDTAASRAFFGDPLRLHRDLLSDGAKAWIKEHPPEK